MISTLHLLPISNQVSVSKVLSVAPAGRLFACDFAVIGAEGWPEQPWGYEDGRIINIDHHAPTPPMRTRISSTNLALRYVQAQGTAQSDDTVVINHTDCDSVLSSAIIRGDLPPLEEFGIAAIAADHTGEVNAIADLLQALDSGRNYEFSLDNLRKLLAGQALASEAQVALQRRHAKRELAAELVNRGAFTRQDGLAWAVLEDAIDGEFSPALLPDALLIATFSRRANDAGKWNAKFRLGNAAPTNLSLPALIKPVDAGYGGRWNAGSNKRSGGSSLSPEEYVAALLLGMSDLLGMSEYGPSDL